MILGVTGHRPQSLPRSNGWQGADLDYHLTHFAHKRLLDCELGRPTKLISGMAEGWDLACAEAALEIGLPLVAALPFKGQERLWQGRSQERYRSLLARAAHVEIVGSFPHKRYYLERDEWIVDHAAAILALCGKATGGTAYTIDYAGRWCVPTLNVWNEWIMYR